ncbi:Mbeg1-like protein [Listeria sp. ILCC792]|uniref:lipase family protein n=1 Tax=Listeria sp. ILCC792 TaxID=1918331 RepID=UPI0013566B00|nr:Mbeg1-like protein [Listeria sp. ILCC792]
MTDEGNFKLSQWVYSDSKLKVGKTIKIKDGTWTTIKSINSSNGLQAVAVVPTKEYQAYKAGKSNHFSKVVFVSRGSEELADWKQNAKLINNKVDDQFKSYESFVNQFLKDYQVDDYSFTGHSLGGALAQYEAVKHTKNAVTFAAARAYNKLTPEEQAKAKEGKYWNLIKDYRHSDDIVGMLPPNALSFYPQYFMERNTGQKSTLDAFAIGGHMTPTFEGCFGTDGSAQLLYKPADIRKLGQTIQQVGTEYIDNMIQDLEDFRQEQGELFKALYRKYVARTEGGDLNRLSEQDIHDQFSQFAYKRVDGAYRFYDDELLCNQISHLTQEQFAWKKLGIRVVDAANSIEKNDHKLAQILGTNLQEMIQTTNGSNTITGLAGYASGVGISLSRGDKLAGIGGTLAGTVVKKLKGAK